MAFIRLRLGSVRRTDGNTCKMRHQGDRFHRGNGGTDHRDAGLLLALLTHASTEVIIALAKPSCWSTLSASIVVPPGEVI